MQDEPEHTVLPESKQMFYTYIVTFMGDGGGDVKGTQKPIKRAPNTQDWKILSKNK